MLIGICGNDYDYNMGNLKSYTLTLLTTLDYNNGRNIYANYTLNRDYVNYTYVHEINDIAYHLGKAYNATFALDELSDVFDCYCKPSSKDGTKNISNFAKETRKSRIKVMFSAQYFSQINRSLRALTHKIYLTSKNEILPSGKIIPCYDDDATDNLVLGIQECKPMKDGLLPMSKVKYFPVIPEIFNIYNTTEKIFSIDDDYTCSYENCNIAIPELQEL